MNTLLEHTGVRRLFQLTMVALALFLFSLFAVQVKEFGYVGDDVYPQSVISVSGTAERFVIPDTAEFTFSVIEEAPEFADAQAAATEAINEVTAYLEEAGVDRDDIKTSNYSINPRYEYRRDSLTLCTATYCPSSNESRVLVGYEVNQTVRVTTSEIDGVGELIAGVGERGVSSVSSVSFTVEDEDALLKDIRDDAIADARDEAQRIARGLGVKLGRVMNYSDQDSYYPYARAEFAYDSGLGGANAVSASPDLPAGENRLSATVQVTFELR